METNSRSGGKGKKGGVTDVKKARRIAGGESPNIHEDNRSFLLEKKGIKRFWLHGRIDLNCDLEKKKCMLTWQRYPHLMTDGLAKMPYPLGGSTRGVSRKEGKRRVFGGKETIRSNCQKRQWDIREGGNNLVTTNRDRTGEGSSWQGRRKEPVRC